MPCIQALRYWRKYNNKIYWKVRPATEWDCILPILLLLTASTITNKIKKDYMNWPLWYTYLVLLLYAQRTRFWILLNQTKFESEKCNNNPNLVWVNKIQKRFICGHGNWFTMYAKTSLINTKLEYFWTVPTRFSNMSIFIINSNSTWNVYISNNSHYT